MKMTTLMGKPLLRAVLARHGAAARSCRLARRLPRSSAHQCTGAGLALRSLSRAFSTQSRANLAVADDSPEQLLAQSLADREPTLALAHFNRLETPPNQLLSQKLAMLLAKRGDHQQTERAVDILRSVYRRPSLQPDDYTKLASIYVVDACLRHRLLDEALEVHEEAFNVGVTLDLPAYDALVEALVASDRFDDATELLQDISEHNDMSPTERSYFPLLEALVEHQDYEGATTLLQAARNRGVQFTSETFHPLVELADSDEDATDSIVTFLSYVEQVWDEVRMLDEFADALEDEDESYDVRVVDVNLDEDDDDDDEGDDEDQLH